MKLQKKRTFKADCYTWDGSIHFPYVIHVRTREDALNLFEKRGKKYKWIIEKIYEIV